MLATDVSIFGSLASAATTAELSTLTCPSAMTEVRAVFMPSTAVLIPGKLSSFARAVTMSELSTLNLPSLITEVRAVLTLPTLVLMVDVVVLTLEV